jgi:hypothetical protein
MIGGLGRVGVAKPHEKLHISHKVPQDVCNEPVQFFAKRYLHKFMHKYPASRDRSMNICLEPLSSDRFTKIQPGVAVSDR